MKRGIWLIVFVLFMSGCAFGTRRPTLNYTVVLPAASQNNITVKVAEFKDDRTWSKEKVGDVKNMYGMRCADIVPQNSVTGWVTDALKKELSNAGYTVTDEKASSSIEGAVLEVYTDAVWNYGGRVRLNVTLKKDGKEILFREYKAQENCGVNWAATAKSYGKSLETALQGVMKQVIPDINTALNK